MGRDFQTVWHDPSLTHGGMYVATGDYWFPIVSNELQFYLFVVFWCFSGPRFGHWRCFNSVSVSFCTSFFEHFFLVCLFSRIARYSSYFFFFFFTFCVPDLESAHSPGSPGSFWHTMVLRMYYVCSTRCNHRCWGPAAPWSGSRVGNYTNMCTCTIGACMCTSECVHVHVYLLLHISAYFEVC